MSATGKVQRVSSTRELILVTAERLFAERGVFAVSNRQVSEAAGQGNNAAVGYHFGTKTDLVRAIVRRHAEPVEERRVRLVAATGESTELRDWVACLVRPVTDHLAAMGNPTWYARFNAQLMTDPGYRDVLVEEAMSAPSLHLLLERLQRCLPDLPPEVRLERREMTRQLMTHTCAERERALADGTPTPRATWHDAATGLIDAMVGLWQGPVTPSAT